MEPADWKELPRPATPGPWDKTYVCTAVRHIARNCDYIEGDDPHFGWNRYGDAVAIAALPEYVAEVERLRAWVDAFIKGWPRNPTTYDATKRIRAGEWPDGREA